MTPIKKENYMNIEKPYVRSNSTSSHPGTSELEIFPSELYQDLLKVKGHLGTNTWTENMSKFLLGSRNGISIINLEYTLVCLRRVLQFLENMNKHKDTKLSNIQTISRTFEKRGFELTSPHILFVNTHTKYSELVKQTALLSNQSYINERWIGGTLTNWKQISESILLYNKFSIQFDNFLMLNNIQIPIYQKAKKRYEGLTLKTDNRYTKGTRDFSQKSLFASSYIPDIIILTNPDQNNIVIKEAQLFKIPVIAFADTNTKTLGIDYIIPGNNKSIFFMYFCLNLITITLQKK